MSRAEKISRYRHLRAIAKEHHNAAVKFVGGPTMMETARRIGLARGNTIICDNPDDPRASYSISRFTPARMDGRVVSIGMRGR